MEGKEGCEVKEIYNVEVTCVCQTEWEGSKRQDKTTAGERGQGRRDRIQSIMVGGLFLGSRNAFLYGKEEDTMQIGMHVSLWMCSCVWLYCHNDVQCEGISKGRENRVTRKLKRKGMK